MKKFLLGLLTVGFLSGCASFQTDDIESKTTVAVLDFTKYSKEGFFITPEPYSGEYKTLGIVNSSIESGAHLEEYTKEDPDTGETVKTKKWVVEPVDIYSLLDAVYQKAVKIGGDAIMNFRYQITSTTMTVQYEPYHLNLDKMIIQGVVIDRLEE